MDNTEDILEAIRDATATYQPSAEVSDSLRDKTLVMLVGPVAVGKSYIVDQITRHDPLFKQVSIFTTREGRPDEDPELNKIRPHTRDSLAHILDEIKNGELVQYTIHPTTGRIYGTRPEDYHAMYNLLPTMSGAVDSRTSLPFASSVVICLVARPEVWLLWLNTRYPDKSEERNRRLNEAIISLQWTLHDEHQGKVVWVENSVETPERTVEDIINIVKYKEQGDSTPKEYAKQMLELAIKEQEG